MQDTSVQTLSNSHLYEAGLRTEVELMPFQLEDVSNLREMSRVLIANEMGTGKTFEGVARDILLRQDDPMPKMMTLVIAPLSVVDSWKEHFEMMTDLKVRTIDKKARYKFLQDKDADVYILHWDVLRLMPELQKVKWHHIIRDECHKGKNRKAKQTAASRKLVANHKTDLSGTPMINRPDELWAILDYLYPGKFGRYWQFYENYCTWDVHPQGFHLNVRPRDETIPILRKKMEPFYIRRKKKEVLPDLPDKYYTTRWVDLGAQQRRAYDQMAKEMLAWVGLNEDKPLVAPVVIARLMRLQQLALTFGDFDIGTDGEWHYVPALPSAKFEALYDDLEDLGEQKIVVFSQFRQVIDLLEEQLVKKKYNVVKLTGTVPQAQRTANINAFQEPDGPQVFLATIKAGGVGINLQVASTVAFLDRDWSPANNNQAEDRLHRKGQKNAVQVIDYMARDTVDLGRHQRLEQKWSWIKQILD